jgi:Uma2 family endonuclease
VYYSPLDVILSDLDVVQPDLVFLTNERLASLDAALRGPADIAVEVASPGSRRQDEVLKRDLYERASVPEYWLVDPDAETIKVYRRAGGSFPRPELLSCRDGDVLRTPQLPGFEIALAVVFAP